MFTPIVCQFSCRILLAWSFLALAVFLTGCAGGTPDSGRTTLVVYAAASLTEPFERIGSRFEKENPEVDVLFNLAGSQQLAHQLSQGAPADIFASANERQMQVAIQTKRVALGERRTFVRNRLVVIFPKENPADIHTLSDLAKPGLKLIFAAREVPVGAYTLDFLQAVSQDYGSDYENKVLSNVVSFEENVKAVLSKIALGEADAGVVYKSDVVGDTGSNVKQIEIPERFNVEAKYPIAVISDSSQPELAETFVQFVLSPEGQKILREAGFIPVRSDMK